MRLIAVALLIMLLIFVSASTAPSQKLYLMDDLSANPAKWPSNTPELVDLQGRALANAFCRLAEQDYRINRLLSCFSALNFGAEYITDGGTVACFDIGEYSFRPPRPREYAGPLLIGFAPKNVVEKKTTVHYAYVNDHSYHLIVPSELYGERFAIADSLRAMAEYISEENGIFAELEAEDMFVAAMDAQTNGRYTIEVCKLVSKVNWLGDQMVLKLSQEELSVLDNACEIYPTPIQAISYSFHVYLDVGLCALETRYEGKNVDMAKRELFRTLWRGFMNAQQGDGAPQGAPSQNIKTIYLLTQTRHS